jgi:predicted deacylase
VNLYDRVIPDQPVATVTDLFGDVRQTVRAPRAGIVWSRCLYPSIATGEMIVTLGVEPRLL